MSHRHLVRDAHPAAFWLALAVVWVASAAAMVWAVVVLPGHAG